MSGLTYLITGANRGIGLGLAAHYLNLPNTTVIAAVRNPSSAGDLKALPAGKGAKLIVVKIDSLSRTDPATAVAELKSKYSISHLDVVIANAGLGSFWGTALDTPIDEFVQHFQVNATGTLLLFQAVYELLSKAKEPKFVPIGTQVGSISQIESFPLGATAYGTSKAALNFLTRKLHMEHQNMVIFPLAPGWVQTEMGKGAAVSVGIADAPTTIDESVAGLTKIIDESTREKTSGIFANYDGTTVTW
ncbi:NAD(P)-binding protein [Lepidopterella palustris CBS 459.81]|uniref:NAD(P)-binding protein n=1 Tax=Lepidopterella palustris CBS 459.81 TaxID=1314670 RepID=A0A8E2JB94_9PEZI|nr:NAD(P)-binding protein [Lepidopterella palustris CBS 459.81]